MSLIYLALLGLTAFIAIWILFVIPAERRYHERRLESLQKRIEKREAALKERQSATQAGSLPGKD